MKIRILRPETWTDFTIAQLPPHSLAVYLALLTHADDAGIAVNDAAQIKFSIPYINGHLSTEQVREALDSLLWLKLAHEYSYNGESYLILTGFREGQTIRKPFYKFPAPDGEVPDKGKYRPEYKITYSVTSKGIIAENGEEIPQCDTGTSPGPYRDSTSDVLVMTQEGKNSNSKRNSKRTETETGNRKAKDASLACLLELPMADGKTYQFTEADRQELAETYPSLDVMQHVRNALYWMKNTDRGKQYQCKNAKSFLGNWMKKQLTFQAQDEAKKPAWAKQQNAPQRPRYQKGVPLSGDPLPDEEPELFADWEGENHE